MNRLAGLFLVLLLFVIALSIGACGGGSQGGGETSQEPTTPVVTVTPASGSITTAQPLAVTITVSGASGTATGSVVLSSGVYTSSAATLTAGSASITIAAASLAAGSDTLTVKYTPDAASSSIYNSATGNGSVTVTQAASYLTAPANGATVSPQNTQFTWTAVPGVIKYTLWLGSTPGAQDVLWWSTAQTSNPSGVLSTATTLLPGITYYATLWTLTSAGYTSTASTFQTSATSYLTAPANGATVSPQNIQFTWTAVPGVISYSLWIGTTAGAQDAFYYTTAHLPNPAGTTSANATLLPSTTYYATLGTLTSSGTTFTTSIFTTSATSFLTAPANGATVSPQNIQFTWIAVPGVINYTLWLGSTPGAQDVLWYSTAQTSNPSGILSTATTLLPGITYYATLWTLTSAGYTSTASTFLTSGTAFVTSPENGATNLDPAVPIAVSWTPVATASSYELTLGSSAGANNYYDSGAITITSTSVSLSPNTTYYARIWTNNAGSRVSTDSVFSTGYGLAHLTYPFDGETGVSQFRPFTWSVPAGATSFGLGVSPTGYTNDDFFIGQGGRIQSPNASEYVWALQPNTTYYVQLCTINPGPNGGGCVNSSFTTGPALPNPSDPKAFYQSIQYLTGQVRQMTIGTSNVPAPGTYLYQFIANRGVNPALSTTCGYFAAALLDQFTMNNILARQREVTLNGAVNHVTTEYWDPFNQKWEVADPTFGMVYFDATSAVGQSVEDVSALLAGSEYSAIKSLFVTPYGSLYATSFYMDPVTLYNEPIPFGNYDYSGQMNYLPNSPLPFLNVVDLSVMGTAGVYDFQFANPSDSVVIDNNSSSLTITGQNSEGWTSTQTLGPGWQIVFPIPDGMNLYEFKRILF